MNAERIFWPNVILLIFFALFVFAQVRRVFRCKKQKSISAVVKPTQSLNLSRKSEENMSRLPKLPAYVWLLIAFLFISVAALVAPFFIALVQIMLDIMEQIAVFVQSLVLPCICIVVLGGGVLFYLRYVRGDQHEK